MANPNNRQIMTRSMQEYLDAAEIVLPKFLESAGVNADDDQIREAIGRYFAAAEWTNEEQDDLVLLLSAMVLAGLQVAKKLIEEIGEREDEDEGGTETDQAE